MMKADERVDPSSCWNRAADHEPIFVLLGRDESAAAAIRFWANDRIRRGKNRADDPQIISAETLASQCERYSQLYHYHVKKDRDANPRHRQ